MGVGGRAESDVEHVAPEVERIAVAGVVHDHDVFETQTCRVVGSAGGQPEFLQVRSDFRFGHAESQAVLKFSKDSRMLRIGTEDQRVATGVEDRED